MFPKCYLRFDLTWMPAGPLHVGSGTSGPGFVDQGMVKYADGRPYVPGSSLKGRVRHYAAGLYRARRGETCRWQGPPSPGADATDPGPRGCGCPLCLVFGAPGFAPGAVVFTDLLPGEPGTSLIRFSTAMDRWRRTVLDRRLFNTEVFYPVQLHGSVYGWLPSSATETAGGLLYAALRLVPHLGGGRSRGLGWGWLNVKVRGPSDAGDKVEEWVKLWI